MPRVNWLCYVRCPGCGEIINFWREHGISVNIESDGFVTDDDVDFLQTNTGCQNPLCEWSKVKINVKRKTRS